MRVGNVVKLEATKRTIRSSCVTWMTWMGRCLLVRQCDRTAQSDTFSESALGAGMSENGNALLELRWHRICTSGSAIEMSEVECAENCRDSTAERQIQKIQKMLHSKVQNMLMPDQNRHNSFRRRCTAAAGTAKETQRGAHW